MKLTTLFLSLFLLAKSALALNFSGVQSIVGVNGPPTSVFVAPASSNYFIKGYLSLPWGSNTGGTAYSRVVATVSKNYVTLLYTGLPGASGFHIPQMTLVSNDRISVNLTSPLAAESVTGMGLNAFTGQIYYGNNF